MALTPKNIEIPDIDMTALKDQVLKVKHSNSGHILDAASYSMRSSPIRLFQKTTGECVLQYSTGFGWEDIPVVQEDPNAQ